MPLHSSAIEAAYWWDAIRSHGAVRTVISLPGGRGRAEDPRPRQALSDRHRGAEGRLARRPRRRVLRAARPQRRRQVDADPLHDRARAADLGLDPRLRPRRRRTHYEQARARRRPRAAGPQPRLVPDRRGDARLPRRLLRDAAQRPPRARQGAARGLLADREARRAHAHAVGRHEAAADPRARADAPAAAADPRRADRRRRRRAAARAVALRPAHQRARARRSCSRRTTSRRPSSSATGSPSSTTGEIVARRARATSWPRSYGVVGLEDAYLELVGRKELSRAHRSTRGRV